MYTEADLKAKTVKDLKEIAKQVGAPATGKKDELIGAILAAAAEPAADAEEDNGAGLEDAGDELEEEPAAEEAAAAAAAAADGSAAAGKHAAIVFNVAAKKPETEKKANIVGVTTLSDAERVQLRASKFGGSLAATKAAAGKASSDKAAPKPAAGSAAKSLEDQVKLLERAVKYGTANDADTKKLEQLKKQLEAQKDKQRLALDKVELMDPDKMAAREKKFGKALTAGAASAKDLKDPDLLKKRAAKFGKVVAPSSNADDDARKKARLERFAKEKK